MSGRGHNPNNRYHNRWKYKKNKKSAGGENLSDPEGNPKKNSKKRDQNIGNVENSENDGYKATNPVDDDQVPKRVRKKRKEEILYVGWDLYFHDEEYQKNSDTVKKIQVMAKFMEKNQELISKAHLEVGGPFNLDVNKIFESDVFSEEWPEFKNDLKTKPSHTLNCVGLAVHQTIVDTLKVNDSESSDEVPMIRVRILNYLPIMRLTDIQNICYGELVTTRGCVMRVSKCTQLAEWSVYFCIRCKQKMIVYQPRGITTLPKKCDTCGSSKFDKEDETPYEKSVSFQRIRLQEHLGDNRDERLAGLRMIEVHLIDDMVDTCMPGADIVVTGIVKGGESEAGKSKKDADLNFHLHIEAVSITSNKTNSKTKGMMIIDLNYNDYASIKEIHSSPNIFALLVHSMCPNIYGHELIKAGLLLSLFGGNSASPEVREDIHVLLVGDPGLGKSQMLIACSRVAPRGVYICGNASTASGLTVTLLKEPGTNDYVLEPGALVLANRGCCVIDEFDKMSTQHQALLEAMEQQCVSVAKSGIIWSLPARTSILAAANPIGGQFDKCKTIRENLNLSQPLLSRFDLVFLLIDNPNLEHDTCVIQHVMAHRKGKDWTGPSTSNAGKYTSMDTFDTLKETLVNYMKGNPDVVPQSILRKYIAYARQYVRPKLSYAAAKMLKDFYLDLRQKQESIGNIPIFFRTLEASIRLTTARAKAELREVATEQDALEVIEIMKETINKVPNEKAPSKPNISSKTGKPTKNKIQAFINLLKQERRSEKQLFSTSELTEIAEDNGIRMDDMTQFIEQLNEKGFLLKKGKNLYKFLPT